MAETVIILGAGASRHMGAPLMVDFLDRVEEVRRAHPGLVTTDAFDQVLALIYTHLKPLAATSVVDLRNVESVFGLVEMGHLIGKLPGQTLEPAAAAEAMRTVLAETLEYSCNFPVVDGRVMPPPAYAALVQGYSDKDTMRLVPGSVAFITFNYDIGLDYAVHWHNNSIDYAATSLGPGEIPILKLHGSVHWTGDGGAAARAFDFSELVTHGSVMHAKRKLAFLSPKRLLSRSGLPQERAIVPPSWNKTQYHNQFAEIWQRAARELSSARQIVVAGFAANGTDAFFKDLLALSIFDNSNLRTVTVINPDATAVQNIRDQLGPYLQSRFEMRPQKFEEWTGAPRYRSP